MESQELAADYFTKSQPFETSPTGSRCSRVGIPTGCRWVTHPPYPTHGLWGIKLWGWVFHESVTSAPNPIVRTEVRAATSAPVSPTPRLRSRPPSRPRRSPSRLPRRTRGRATGTVSPPARRRASALTARGASSSDAAARRAARRYADTFDDKGRHLVSHTNGGNCTTSLNQQLPAASGQRGTMMVSAAVA